MPEAPAERPRVVIVGAGFGGLNAVYALRDAPVDVLVVDRHNFHLFQPLLYQVATAGLTPSEISRPVRTIFRSQKNFDFRMDEVTGVDLAGRALAAGGGRISYDFLILAIGGQTNYFGLQGVASHGFGLKDVGDAVALRNHVLFCFERAAAQADPAGRRALLTFAVAGGGPTGVEMAGALSELTRLALAKDYPHIDPQQVRIVIIEAQSRLLETVPEDLAGKAVVSLRRKGVDILVGKSVADYDGREVLLKDGEKIPACTLIWAAGIKAADLAASLGAPTARQGRIIVERTLQLQGHPEVYVIGDAAFLESEGKPLPMVAPVAIQQGKLAAANVLRQIRGEPLEPFRYKDPGTLATIGRNSAVAYIHGWKLSGFLAWVVWLVVHLIQLIGFRNRIVVLINWAWDYFLYERAVRLITRE